MKQGQTGLLDLILLQSNNTDRATLYAEGFFLMHTFSLLYLQDMFDRMYGLMAVTSSNLLISTWSNGLDNGTLCSAL